MLKGFKIVIKANEVPFISLFFFKDGGVWTLETKYQPRIKSSGDVFAWDAAELRCSHDPIHSL